MQRRWWLGAILIGALTPEGSAQTSRQPVPSADAQAKAQSLIQELYGAELSKAEKDPAMGSRLAATFLQEGKETRDLIAGRYRLFLAARDLATAAGDAAIALQAIEELAQDFTIPPQKIFAMKIQALQAASKSPTSDSFQAIVDSALALSEEALALDDYQAALQLLNTAEAAGIKLRSVPLVSSIRRRQDEVKRMDQIFERWRPFAETLARNADDPAANREMGAYYALVKGNWERGLPLLARGDGPLRTIAADDLQQPEQPAQQIALAERWHAVGTKSEGAMRHHALARAYHWYQTALNEIEAAARPDLEKRLQGITELLPPELRIGEINSESKKFEAHVGPVYAAAFSPDGKRAVSAGADSALRIWDTRTGKELRRLDGHNGRIWTVAFSPDGRRLVSGGFDGSVRIWDPISGRELRRFQHDDYVRGAVFSRDGRFILAGGDDKLVRLWNLETGKEERGFRGHDHFVWDVALSRDGDRALSASLDKTVRLWDVKSGQELKRLTGHRDTVLSVAFSPDGRRALSGSTDKTLILWNLETGEPIRTFTGHKGYVHSVAFAPDGRRVLSASQDNTIRLWDTATGELVRTLEGHRGQVWDVAFSRDGRLALSAGQDETARVWK